MLFFLSLFSIFALPLSFLLHFATFLTLSWNLSDSQDLVRFVPFEREWESACDVIDYFLYSVPFLSLNLPLFIYLSLFVASVCPFVSGFSIFTSCVSFR